MMPPMRRRPAEFSESESAVPESASKGVVCSIRESRSRLWSTCLIYHACKWGIAPRGLRPAANGFDSCRKSLQLGIIEVLNG